MQRTSHTEEAQTTLHVLYRVSAPVVHHLSQGYVHVQHAFETHMVHIVISYLSADRKDRYSGRHRGSQLRHCTRLFLHVPFFVAAYSS
jgi:hypothetical protein